MYDCECVKLTLAKVEDAIFWRQILFAFLSTTAHAKLKCTHTDEREKRKGDQSVTAADENLCEEEKGGKSIQWSKSEMGGKSQNG